MISDFNKNVQKITDALQLLSEDMQVSDLDVIESYPGLGVVSAPRPRRDRSRFLAYARGLIDRGVPQLTPKTAYDYQDDQRYSAFPLWLVGGVPSRSGTPTARAWMHQRSQNWDGDVHDLRNEVERALIAGERIPKFGLKILLAILHKID